MSKQTVCPQHPIKLEADQIICDQQDTADQRESAQQSVLQTRHPFKGSEAERTMQ